MAASDLLLVLDGSRAARAVVGYAATLLARRRDARVGLLYLLPNLPPELLEFGGAESPAREERLDAQLKDRQRAWLAAAKEKARPAIERAAADLRAGGVPAAAIAPRFFEPGSRPHPADALADEILAIARRQRYGTVVAKRGHQTATGEDLGAALAARGAAVSVCLVK